LVQPLRKRRPYVSWNWLGNDQVEIGAQTWRLELDPIRGTTGRWI
jgi:hypothetical protein